MKRSTPPSPKLAAGKLRTLGARRLAAIRGGSGLGIAVDVVTPPPPIMPQQHNEALIRL